MIELPPLTPDSTLGDLPLNDFQVDQTTLGETVAERFERDPQLPGVIITNGDRLVGLLSRQKFLERMSRRFSIEIYLKRPIAVLFSFVEESSSLQLPHTCKIDQASAQALNRPTAVVYDPIMVRQPDQTYRLLDSHVLLLAQSRILALVNRVAQRQKKDLQRYVVQLRQAQLKTEDAKRLLETQQVSIRDRNQLLEEQQLALTQQSAEIQQLNQRFMQIGEILSDEGKKAFQATFESVDAIAKNTDNMVEIGKALATQLESIQGASSLIKDISKRARFLSMQAAILANQFGGLEGVSRITSDISQLSAQSFEAGQWMDETATHLKTQINDLTQMARDGASVAQTLIQKISRAEVALVELEYLLSDQKDGPAALAEVNADAIHQVMQRVAETGLALSELERMATHGEIGRLINKIERRLKYSNRPIADN